MAAKNNILPVMVMLPIPFLLIWCSDGSGIDSRDNSVMGNSKSAVECLKSIDSEGQALCIDSFLASISDPWIRRCAVGNIDEKKTLATSLNNWTATGPELRDVDTLIKECAAYDKTQKPASSSGTPVFSSFLSSAAGSFIWSAVADMLFGNGIAPYGRYETASNNGSGSSNSAGYRVPWSLRSGDGVGASNTTAWKVGGKTTSEIEAQYKKSTWDIKSMKSASEATTNYKLGDTGTRWSSTENRSSSSNGWSTKWSSSSSESISNGWSSSRSSGFSRGGGSSLG